MSTHHTPGPWTINGGAIEGPPQEVPGCDRPLSSIVAHVYDESDNGPPESDANAHLIAAAPELLAALTTIAALAENSHWTTDRRWRIAEVAGRAIRLAQGR